LFSHRQETALCQFINASLLKNPSLKLLFGGARSAMLIDHFARLSKFKKTNSFSVMGQNRERDIVVQVKKMLGIDGPTPDISFIDVKPEWKKIFGDHPPAGIVGSIDLSRNCIFDCAFCTYQNRKTASKYKSVDQIVVELEEYYSVFKNPIMYLTCNTFNEDIGKIRTVMEAVSRLKFDPQFFAYIRADLFASQPEDIQNWIIKYVKFPFFGIESLKSNTARIVAKSPKTNNVIEAIKKVRNLSADSHITMSFIAGLPGEFYFDLLDSVTIASEIADYVILNALRLQLYSEGDDKRLFSRMELNPELFGYKILKPGERVNSVSDEKLSNIGLKSDAFLHFQGWVRDDGYDFEQAILDSCVAISKIKQGDSYHRQMFLRARGKDLQTEKHIGHATTDSHISSYFVRDQKYHTGDNEHIQQVEIDNFRSEMFDFYMSS
jgi:hypothetical protein